MENFEIGNLLSIYSTEEHSTVINISPDSKKDYVYTLYLTLDKEKTLLFSENSRKYCNEKVKIYINDFSLLEEDYIDKLTDKNSISVTFTNKLVSTEKKLSFKNTEDFKKYLKLFFANIKIGDLAKVENKINFEILANSVNDFSSSIFSVNCNEKIELYSIFKNERLYRDQKIIGIIDTVPEEFRIGKEADIIAGFLSILSDRIIKKDNSEEYVISLGNRSYITAEDIELSAKTIDNLYDIQKFIFRSSEKYYDRLNIFRNIFSEKIENECNITDDLLYQILEDSKLHYKLFIGDKIKQFIQQKQKITEDYVKFNENIVKSINSATEEIPKQLLTTIGIIITTFFLKGIDKSDQIWVVPLLALIYFGTYVIFKCKKGWFFESENFEKKKQLMDESYKELYTFDEEFIKKLKEEYLEPPLFELKKMESLTRDTVFFIFGLISICFLWA
ncbi:hypothetical protein [Vagococcus fessus]|uniref:Uncharacterized protein n=1 Tax=Vagococcus fessus TaxID=120370 RepID=A0A430ACM2_9ENTE|nr:hypothetical protein [Vagococcus fessus]RSU04960.1 hypothetical protein CBF31_02765 [Vagococcus fessus]